MNDNRVYFVLYYQMRDYEGGRTLEDLIKYVEDRVAGIPEDDDDSDQSDMSDDEGEEPDIPKDEL